MAERFVLPHLSSHFAVKYRQSCLKKLWVQIILKRRPSLRPNKWMNLKQWALMKKIKKYKQDDLLRENGAFEFHSLSSRLLALWQHWILFFRNASTRCENAQLLKESSGSQVKLNFKIFNNFFKVKRRKLELKAKNTAKMLAPNLPIFQLQERYSRKEKTSLTHKEIFGSLASFWIVFYSSVIFFR